VKKVTILIPCFNESAGLRQFYECTQKILSRLAGYKFHMIFVDDGSKDDTLKIMQELHEQDRAVSYVSLSRNFGKETAMLAGLDYAEGDAVILMDADLQDPPALLPEMLAEWEKGYADVYARRRSRRGEPWLKRMTAHLYYWILRHVANIDIQINVGDFRLLDKQAVEALRSLRERQRYTKGLFSWIGYRKKEILFDRGPRAAGRTKWNYLKLCGLALDGLTSFSVVPLRFASVLGLLISAVAFVYMIFIVIRTIFYGDPVAGYPSLVSIVLFLGGIQLVVLGIIGEYLGRIFTESKHRPEYLVSEYNGKKIILYTEARQGGLK
jgi:polyisoprenyl-phosphate glycosyltransferase